MVLVPKKFARGILVWSFVVPLLGFAITSPAFSAGTATSPFTDYKEAVAQAKQDGKMLLIAFHGPNDVAVWQNLLRQLSEHPNGKKLLEKHTVALLPTDYTTALAAKLDSKDETNSEAATKLLDHPSFAEMLHRPGLAVLDFTDPKSRYFHYVVSVLPMSSGAPPTLDHALALLDLPVASLTQRTLIFAVRTHPLRPQSAAGTFSSMLADEAESSANYQASINLQGHHNWEARFHRINAKLPAGLLSQEVCAESWPGQTLLESARECVHCWNLSSGHWSAVSAAQPQFAYDMKRGTKGIWYGVGIFGK